MSKTKTSKQKNNRTPLLQKKPNKHTNKQKTKTKQTKTHKKTKRKKKGLSCAFVHFVKLSNMKLKYILVKVIYFYQKIV
jgi:hypothetical protein